MLVDENQLPDAGPHKPKRRSGPPARCRSERRALDRVRTLCDLDYRARPAQQARTILNALVRDLGGDPSAAQQTLCERVSLLVVAAQDIESRFAAGEPANLALLNTITNTIRRCLVSLGLERRTKDVSGLDLDSYAKSLRKRQDEPEDEADE